MLGLTKEAILTLLHAHIQYFRKIGNLSTSVVGISMKSSQNERKTYLVRKNQQLQNTTALLLEIEFQVFNHKKSEKFRNLR